MRWAKGAGLVLLGGYGVWGAFHPSWFGILDGANLLFHEAGHVLLSWLGEYWGIWGGTLFQVFFPLGIAAGFLRQRQPVSASVMVGWAGQNLFLVAAYIRDARAQVLPRVGGEVHDWAYLLSRHRLLEQDQRIGQGVWLLGLFIMLAACVYGLNALRRQKEQKVPAAL